MNYLAHLYLAKPNADSHFGNLLGDFGGSTKLSQISSSVELGLQNHYMVDRFTDGHELVKQAKQLFNRNHRRFAGIALDVLFDHFLIKHWHLFHHTPFELFKQNSYQLLQERLNVMPERMSKTILRVTTDDWFEQYRTQTGVAMALKNIAKRIRFDNSFDKSTEDVALHYQEFEQVFMGFFPELVTYVEQHSPEN